MLQSINMAATKKLAAPIYCCPIDLEFSTYLHGATRVKSVVQQEIFSKQKKILICVSILNFESDFRMNPRFYCPSRERTWYCFCFWNNNLARILIFDL